jgi:ElaB/YqjD/DUF883 family membrane-anchored ribosome-binding protein
MLNVAVFIALVVKGNAEPWRRSRSLLSEFRLFERSTMDTYSRSAAGAHATREIEAALDDITARGVAAIRDSKSGFDGAVANVADTGRDALDGARAVRATVADAILNSIEVRPYTTLAIAGAIGFIYGALRRR